METAGGNAALVRAIYASFGRGDVPGLLAVLSPDVDWRIAGPVMVPYAGRFQGAAAVADFFTRLAGAVEFHTFEPREFVAEGDTVVVLGFESCTAKATGRRFDNEWVHLFTLRDGKVVRFREFGDTAALLAAFS